MGKRIQTPEPIETVTLPKTSIDLIFETLEAMKSEISELRMELANVPKETRLLSVEQAAEYCGVTRQTIAQYRRENRIQKSMVGCKIGYTIEELNKVRKAPKTK